MLCRLLCVGSYLAVMIIALTTDTQNPTLQADWIGIFMLGDKRVFTSFRWQKIPSLFLGCPSPFQDA